MDHSGTANKRALMAGEDVLPSPEILQAIGTLTVRHSQLDAEVKRIFKSLTGSHLEDVLRATDGEMSAAMRMRVLKLAKRRFGDGKAYTGLQALMSRARDLSKERNAYLHSYWGRKLGSDRPPRMLVGVTWKEPSAPEILQIADDMQKLTDEIGHERLKGWLHNAISNTKQLT